MADFSRFSLADVNISAKGAKTAALTCGGERFHYTTDLTRAPFGPGSFERDPAATRQNLELRATSNMEEFFSSLDAWAIEYLTAHSQRLFKKPLTLAQVREMYHPTLRRAEGYTPLLRTKISMPPSRGAIKCWTAEGQPREAPKDWREAEVKARVHVSHVWFMGAACGIVCNCTDLLVIESTGAFPFGAPELPA